MRRSPLLAVALVVASCGSDPGTKTPKLRLGYQPSPPVAGQPLAFTFDGADLGVVELYQGPELLARVVNPLEQDVPDGFYVFLAKSAETPRAVVFDADGRTIEVAATPGTGPAPRPAPVDAGPVDAAPPPPPPGPTFTATCPGFDPQPDSGAVCGPSGLLVTGQIRNDYATTIKLATSTFEAGTCTTPAGRLVRPGTVTEFTTFDNQQFLVMDAFTNTVLRNYRIAPGTQGPCYLSVR